jgi:hypothetical protein
MLITYTHIQIINGDIFKDDERNNKHSQIVNINQFYLTGTYSTTENSKI